jgi:hypothetical protein
MACGGCNAVRTAGLAGLAALASGDKSAFEASVREMERVAKADLAGQRTKQAVTRMSASGLARLGARMGGRNG